MFTEKQEIIITYPIIRVNKDIIEIQTLIQN